MAGAFAIVVRQSSIGPSVAASNIAARIELISSSPLFSGLTNIAYEEIARRARPKALVREELLFMQGQPFDNLALIRSGSVKVTQLAPNGNEVILWMYGAGNVVGALPEHSARLHNCSARAMEPSTALLWETEYLQKLMVQYPQIGQNISPILAGRLSELEERFREVATEKVAKRVALALQRLLKQIGKETPGGVEISLSREELAQMTGTTLFTTSRILSHWSKKGIIAPGRSSVLVCDAQRLELAGDEDFETGTLTVRGKRKSGYLRTPAGVFGLSLVDRSSRPAGEARC